MADLSIDDLLKASENEPEITYHTNPDIDNLLKASENEPEIDSTGNSIPIPTATQVAKNIDKYAPQQEANPYPNNYATNVARDLSQNLETQKRYNQPGQDPTGFLTAGNVMGTAYAPLGELIPSTWRGIGDLANKYGSPEIYNALNKYVVNTTEQALGNFAKENPKAAEYAGAALNMSPFEGKLAESLSPVAKGASPIYEALNKDTGGNVSDVLNNAAQTPNKSLFEASLESPEQGINTQRLAQQALSQPAGAKGIGEFFEQKKTDLRNQINPILEENVAPNTGVDAYKAALEATIKPQAAPMYDAFYKSSKAIVSPQLDDILASDAGKQALKEAAKNMHNELITNVGNPNPELTAAMREAEQLGQMDYSKGGVAAGLKPQTVVYVKRALDDMARTNDVAESRRMSNLARSVNNILKDNDPSAFKDSTGKVIQPGNYEYANEIYSNMKKMQNAADEGANFLRDSKKPQSLLYQFNNYSPTEQQAYRVGMQQDLYNKINSVSDKGNYTKYFQNPATRESLKGILKPEEYNALEQHALSVDRINNAQANVFSDKELRPIISNPNAAIQLAKMNPKVNAAAHVINLVKSTFGGLSNDEAGSIASLLTEADPAKKADNIASLVKMQDNNPNASRVLNAFYSIRNRTFKNAPSAIANTTANKLNNNLQPLYQGNQ